MHAFITGGSGFVGRNLIALLKARGDVVRAVEDWGRYEEFYRVNVIGTENVLQAARISGVKKFVHVSTETVLAGGPPIHNADETWPRAKNPLGLYPLTKGLAEERVLAANSPELTTVIVRPRFIWGKGDTSLLPQIILPCSAANLCGSTTAAV